MDDNSRHASYFGLFAGSLVGFLVVGTIGGAYIGRRAASECSATAGLGSFAHFAVECARKGGYVNGYYSEMALKYGEQPKLSCVVSTEVKP